MNEILPKVYKQGDPIPLHLECTVNGTVIYYDFVKHTLEYTGYIFYVDNDIPEKEAEEKVKILINRILDDHDEYEHGVSWRTTSFEHVEHPLYHMFEWHYRVRDSY